MEEITTLMQRGLAAGVNDEWYDDEWCVDVVKKYVNESEHTTNDEALLQKFIAHAYDEFSIDFLQYMPDLLKPDYDFWAKVHAQLPERTQSDDFERHNNAAFFCNLISEYSNSDYGFPNDIRWYESMSEVCDVDFYVQETIFDLFKTVYLNCSSDYYKHQIVKHTKAWLDRIGQSCFDFYLEEPYEIMQYMEDHPENEECRFFLEVEDQNLPTDFYKANGKNIINDEDDGHDDAEEDDNNKEVEAIQARFLAWDQIEQFKSKLPSELNSSSTLSDVYLDEDIVTFELMVDGNFISIDNIKNNVDVYKEGSISVIVSNMNDLCSIFQAAGLGVRIQYQDCETAQTAEINISNDELAYALQNPDNEQQQLEFRIRSLKATCPRDLGGGFELTDFALDGQYVTRTIVVDEAEFEMNDVAAESEQLRKVLSDSVLNDDNYDFIELVYKTAKGLRDRYVGKDTGQTVEVELSFNDIQDIILKYLTMCN